MQERLTLTPKIIELNTESNDIFMTMDICILSNDVNYNNAKFTDDFIEGVIENKNTYIGIPFLASRSKLESGAYDSLTHEFDGKTLNTDSIGSFVDFWSEMIDGALCLMGRIKIFKRFENTCNAIIELYNEGLLETSCEVLVASYESVEDGVRVIHYNNGENLLIGSAIVTNGAEKRAKATLLIAEAYEKDLVEGGEKMGDKKQAETFNKGIKIKHHGSFESFAIKLGEIENQIYNLLNPIDPKTNNRRYNYYILDLYNEYVIVEDWNDYTTLYKISYKIENDVVVLDSQDNWVSGYRGFIPDGITIDDLLAEKEKLTAELSSLENKHKEELEEMEKELQKRIEELQEELKKLENTNKSLSDKVEELNGVIVSQKEQLDEKEKVEAELNEQISELTKFKEQVELAKKEALKQELSEKYSKLLSKEVFESDEAKAAIEACDTSKLNELVVSEIAKKTSTKKDEVEVITFASRDEDLTPISTRDYLLSEVESE